VHTSAVPLDRLSALVGRFDYHVPVHRSDRFEDSLIYPFRLEERIAGGISNIQNVSGSQGNDLIVGDAAPNALEGGTGRNILIGGTTLWDANAVALQALMQEWKNPNVTFDQRVNALKKGIVVNNKTYALNSATVFADASPDSLVGGGGRNWFWVDNDDTINNGAGPKSMDRVNQVDRQKSFLTRVLCR
jgi:Ca2+-binding RTX toxin-like protein